MRSRVWGMSGWIQGTIRETVDTGWISDPDSALAIYEFCVTVRIDVVDLRIAARSLADDLGQWPARSMPQHERLYRKKPNAIISVKDLFRVLP